jgi:histidyl-tRNA synthetase
MFGLKGVSGVGISLGADRIYDILLENDLFPNDGLDALDVFFVNFGETEERFLMPLVGKLRSKGVSVEVYPSSAKMKKQMSYADSKKARYVVLIGESEIESRLIRVKEMSSGNQEDISFEKFLQNF